MTENLNDQKFSCDDHEALVAYLYDECAPENRQAIAAHLAVCAACAVEVEGLAATRQMLAAWTPPAAALGFQITQATGPRAVASSEPPGADSRVVHGGARRWWQRPLPAWAQAAAAAVIFAAGLAAGSARSAAGDGTPASRAGTSVATGVVSADDLARVERQLRAEMAKVLDGSSSASTTEMLRASGQPPAADTRAVIERVEALIAESEQRQRAELLQRSADIITAFETQRRYDLAKIFERVGMFEGQTVSEVKQHREAISALVHLMAATDVGR